MNFHMKMLLNNHFINYFSILDLCLHINNQQAQVQDVLD